MGDLGQAVTQALLSGQVFAKQTEAAGNAGFQDS